MYARELAYYLGISESMVSRLLSGARKPSLELIIKVRQVLGWSVEDQAWMIERHGIEAYGIRLRVKMEAADVQIDPDVPSVRSLP